MTQHLPMTPEQKRAQQEKIIAKKKRTMQAYRNLFKGPDAQIVLDDLRKRLYADWPTTDPRMPEWYAHVNAGMRNAWIHIDRRLNGSMDNLTIQPEDEV